VIGSFGIDKGQKFGFGFGFGFWFCLTGNQNMKKIFYFDLGMSQ
jgi:hypothetical protein